MTAPLMTLALKAKLMANWKQNALSEVTVDHFPVMKAFTPDANVIWLFTELDPSDEDTLFGLCDLGLGFPELGYVSFSELQAVRGPLGLYVERDLHFKAQHPLSWYVEQAQYAQRIVT
jgi:hypothetical protein